MTELEPTLGVTTLVESLYASDGRRVVLISDTDLGPLALVVMDGDTPRHYWLRETDLTGGEQ